MSKKRLGNFEGIMSITLIGIMLGVAGALFYNEIRGREIERNSGESRYITTPDYSEGEFAALVLGGFMGGIISSPVGLFIYVWKKQSATESEIETLIK